MVRLDLFLESYQGTGKVMIGSSICDATTVPFYREEIGMKDRSCEGGTLEVCFRVGMGGRREKSNDLLFSVICLNKSRETC